MSETSRKITLAHSQDGMVAHVTATGLDPDDAADMALLRQLREAIDRGVRVIAFADADFEVEHIFEPKGDA